jgi:hypothetical protein
MARRCLTNEVRSLVSSPQRFVIAPESLDVARQNVRVDAGRADGTVSEIEAQQQRVVVGAAERHTGVAVDVALRVLLVGIDMPFGRIA